MFRRYDLLLEGEPSALGGAPAPEAPPEAPAGEPQVEGGQSSIWGDVTPKFPENLDSEVAESSFLKPFVDKQSGEVRYSDLMKSYVHAQKNVNTAKVAVPDENSSPEEIDNFYEKIGYVRNEEDYKLELGEDAKLSQDQVKEVKDFARKHRMPLKTAQELVQYMNDKTGESSTQAVQAQEARITEGLNNLKSEWGQAYEPKLGMARRVLDEVVADDSIKEVFADPTIGSNPAVIKALAKIGEGLFKEDSIRGEGGAMLLSPEEASQKINSIMGERTGPYFDKNHPGHKDAVLEVNRLFEMKRGR